MKVPPAAMTKVCWTNKFWQPQVRDGRYQGSFFFFTVQRGEGRSFFDRDK